MRAELEALLASIVTRDAASDALYTHCFPNAVLVETFRERRMRDAAARSRAQPQAASGSAAPSPSIVTPPAESFLVPDGC